MTGPDRRLRHERGFTIVEVVVAATILVVGVLGALTLLDGANRATQRTKAREGATNLAREVIEAARAVNYPSLTPPQLMGELQAQPALADAIASQPGWNLKRRDITYTVTASVCSVDDGTLPSDGLGNHAGGFFCSDSAAEGTVDANPDDYKRLAVTVSWKDGAKTLTARQEAVINNPGSAFAPAIRTLTANPASPITNAAFTSVTFTATTTSKPAEVKWAIDNVAAGKATGSQTTWSFTWNIPATVVDGTYLISAEASDQYGQTGTGRTLTMVLNRFAPQAPKDLVGGRNPLWGPTFAEFEWTPNPERDVLGYRVYRMQGAAPSASDELVCETKIADVTPTACGRTGLPNGDYYVSAVAPNHAGPGTEETRSTRVTVGDAVAVAPPTNVREDVTADDGGAITLTWDLPPDPSSIRYYRIYRDSTLLTGRYGGTGLGTQNAWTDRDGAPGQHRYWVTAVDKLTLAESAFAPPTGLVP